MPVEPIPCAPGGGTGTPGACSCSPSIASAPLCRADGSLVLVVLRSGCVDCSAAPVNPEAIGWVDPLTGAFTAGPVPPDAGPCSIGCSCSPSIATTPLCRADGSTVLLVVRNDCADCDTPAPDPTVVGWLDPLTGVFTPGPAPADAGPCAPGCVETLCRQRCDDTDGDGAADATYSELWCVKGDGSATLLLTYQDDPSSPYTPVAPVDCTYGCAESETRELCDTAPDGTVTAFLRRYSFLDGVGTYEDVALDGQTPYIVTGTVGACSATQACNEPTTPAATLGLCLADGTPIAVVVTRDCDGVVTQDGWINLVTGTYSVGDPPAGTMACGNPRSISTTGTFCDVDPDTGDVYGLVLIEYTYGPDGAVTAVRLVDATTGLTYVPQGEVTTCPAGVEQPERDLVQLCDTAPDGAVTEFVRDYARDETGAITGHSDYLLDGSPYIPAGTVGVCQPEAEPCRDSSSTLLCDTAAQEPVTVFDPANRPGADGWEIVSYTGYPASHGPEAAIPYPVPHPAGNPAYMGVRSDLNVGPGVAWPGYETAPVRWVMRKTFTAPEDGVAVVSSAGFRGDGGARVRVNGQDAGMYGQWNQPATTGTAQIPVTAGPNVVEIEVRDGAGPNWITGRLDIVMARTFQFMRRTVVDCETGETVSVVDTTLDGEPYEVTGEVGQCEPVAECCEQPPPESRVDVETTLLCVRDTASGDILAQVIAERVYDDQSGDLTEQRLTGLDGAAYTLPAGAELAKCPSPDRITRQVCVVESGMSEFLTNPANATSGQDTVWQWAPNLTGLWHPMYRVAPNPVWTATDTAPNQAHWVSPHANRTVCPTAGETSPPVPGTWYTRASWNLPADVDPESIRIAATVLNADNKVVQWRLNDGAWQPVGGGTLANPAWTFPPTAVPGGRAGQNEVVVQLLETQPGLTCPSANEAGMILHVIATYDYEPRVWTQVIEPGGQTYYLDENGDRQDAIPDGQRLVPCGGGGDAPCCPAVNVETITLCDTGDDGTTEFLRHFTYTEGADAPTIRDTLLDGTDYTPTGEVGRCAEAAAGRDVEITPMCVVNNGSGTVVQRILAEVTYDTATGERLSVIYVDPITWGPVAMPGGTHLDVCPPDEEEEPGPDVEVVQLCDLVDGADPVPFLRHLAYLPGATAPAVTDTALDGVTPYVLAGTAGVCSEPCAVRAVVEACRCDDTDGDGLPDVGYVELLGVDCDGALTSLGTYTDGLTEPYTPVSPVDCSTVDDEEGADPAHGVQARRVELAAGASWDAAAWPTLQSVTAVAHSGTGTITAADGPSTLRSGESVTWSVARDVDAALTGPLTITTVTGTVTVSYTIGVTL